MHTTCYIPGILFICIEETLLFPVFSVFFGGSGEVVHMFSDVHSQLTIGCPEIDFELKVGLFSHEKL